MQGRQAVPRDGVGAVRRRRTHIKVEGESVAEGRLERASQPNDTCPHFIKGEDKDRRQSGGVQPVDRSGEALCPLFKLRRAARHRPTLCGQQARPGRSHRGSSTRGGLRRRP